MTTPEELKPLSLAQTKGLAALMNARDIASAAELAEVGERSLHRWLNDDPNFKAHLVKLQNDVLNAVVLRLSSASLAATQTLAEIMNDPDANKGVRVRAADSILSHAIKYHEMVSIENRLATLEDNLSK